MKCRQTLIVVPFIVALAVATASAATGWVLTGDYSQFGRLRSFNQSSP